MSGKTILSCGHEDEHGCMGVSVQFDDEECVAGEGFVPTTVYAQYCHECATKLYYEIGKDTGRVEAGLAADRIEAQAAEIERLHKAGTKLAGYAGHDDGCEIMLKGVWGDNTPCTCGYEDAWKAWAALGETK